MSHEQAVSIISEGAGAQFDDKVVQAFLLVADRFNEYASMNK
jgi:HD-GYP domain-containing protein (c-di-GMP phosphodiesterase class II)